MPFSFWKSQFFETTGWKCKKTNKSPFFHDNIKKKKNSNLFLSSNNFSAEMGSEVFYDPNYKSWLWL